MNTPVPLSMFVIGLIVFILYLSGYVYMIIKASNQQKEEYKKLVDKNKILEEEFDRLLEENNNLRLVKNDK